MSQPYLLAVTLGSLLLLSSLSSANSKPASITLMPPPTCKAFTKDFTLFLQDQYFQRNIQAVGVRGTHGVYRQAWLGREYSLPGDENQDHVAYGRCCEICSDDPDCVGYTIVPRGWRKVKKSSNITVHYNCNIWKKWFLREEPANWYTRSPAGVVFFPASFVRPGPTCEDDAPGAIPGQCPWGMNNVIEPDDNGEVGPQFEGATAENFVEKGKGGVVQGRLLSPSQSAHWVNITYTTPRQCVEETYKMGQFYFTWESCSKTCHIFQNNVCNPFYGNGFSSSTTAFSGKVTTN